MVNYGLAFMAPILQMAFSVAPMDATSNSMLWKHGFVKAFEWAAKDQIEPRDTKPSDPPWMQKISY